MGKTDTSGQGKKRHPAVRSAREGIDATAEMIERGKNEFRAIFEKVSIGLGFGDPRTGRLLGFNEKFRQITGYRAEKLRRMHFFELTHPDDRAEDRMLYERALRGETPQYCNEKRYLRADGSVVWVRVNVSFLRDADGTVLRSLATVEDITDRIRAVEERERFFSVGAELFAVVGYDGNFKWVGPAWERVLGWSPEELTLHSWLYHVHPDDYAATVEEARHLLGGRETLSFENRYRHKDGNWRWLSWRARAYPAEKKVYAAATEITGRKENELWHAALAAIVEHGDDAIVSKTLDGVIKSWNHGAERIFGYRADEMLGKNIAMLLPPDRANEESFILDRVRHGISLDHYESRRVTKSGRAIDVSITVSPIRNERGQIVGASKIARDITDRKLAEEARRVADRHKDEFLAMLGHELRNPLAAIRNAVENCREEVADPSACLWSQQVIDRQSAHLAKIVDDLLDVARITQGKLELRKQEVDLVPVISQAIEAVRSPLEIKRHELHVDIPPDAHFFVMADATRLDQIFINLLNNAIRYTPDGGRIMVAAARHGAEVVILFRDTGIGITPEILPRIFDIFSQGERRLDRGDSGLGLGLHIVRHLVELHGGSVIARSKGAGCGAEFEIRLPLVSERVPTMPAPPLVRAVANITGRRILLVDDNADTIHSLARLLKRRGYDVEMALDGPSGLRKALEFHPQICLLDIGLPGMDGYELARHLRAEGSFGGALLVAVSGYGQKEDRARSREAGFDFHLVKPVDINALLELLNPGHEGKPA